MIRALIFDFDGLILETEGPSLASWDKVYRDFGLELPFSTWLSAIGAAPVAYDPARHLREQVRDEVDWAEVEVKRKAHETSLIEAQKALPGVEEYLADARGMGLKIGLASSSSCKWVVSHLTRLGLTGYFDCIRAADDVSHAKPDPELYQAVLHALGVQAAEAIAFEDSPNGILAAKQAGIYCVAIPNAITSQLSLSEADLQLQSLEEMPLEKLISMVN